MHWGHTIQRLFAKYKRTLNSKLVKSFIAGKLASEGILKEEGLFRIVEDCIIHPQFGVVTIHDRFLLTHLLPQNYKNRYGHLNAVELPVIRSKKHQAEKEKQQCFIWGNKWSQGYYHFVAEDLPKLVCAKQQGFEIYTWQGLSSKWQQELLQLFNIEQTYIVQPTAVRQLYFITTNRVFESANRFSIPNPALMQGLQIGLQELVSSNRFKDLPTDQCIWISRKHTRNRHIENEAECIQLLTKEGYKVQVMYPEKISVAEQIKLVYHSRCLIGPHGAGLTNLAFSQQASLIEIGPAGKVNNSYISLAISLKRSYCHLDAAPVNKWLGSRSNFRLDPVKLLQQLARVF